MGAERCNERKHVPRARDHSRYDHGLLPLNGWIVRYVLQLTHSIAARSARYGLRIPEHDLLLVVPDILPDHVVLPLHRDRSRIGRMDGVSAAFRIAAGDRRFRTRYDHVAHFHD